MADAAGPGTPGQLIAHGAALAAACQEYWRLSRAHGTSRFLVFRFQNASAGSAISVVAPALSRARCAEVSGSIRSLKNLARVNFASRLGLLSDLACRASTALTIRAHM